MIILITASLSSKIYNKASLREECTFEEIKQHCLDHQSFHDFFFALEVCAGLPVLAYSDTVGEVKEFRASSLSSAAE